MSAGALVDRFGAEAIYGRPLRFGEVHRIIVAENVETAYRGYLAAINTEEGVAGWADEHPEAAALIEWALSLE